MPRRIGRFFAQRMVRGKIVILDSLQNAFFHSLKRGDDPKVQANVLPTSLVKVFARRNPIDRIQISRRDHLPPLYRNKLTQEILSVSEEIPKYMSITLQCHVGFRLQ